MRKVGRKDFLKKGISPAAVEGRPGRCPVNMNTEEKGDRIGKSGIFGKNYGEVNRGEMEGRSRGTSVAYCPKGGEHDYLKKKGAGRGRKGDSPVRGERRPTSVEDGRESKSSLRGAMTCPISLRDETRSQGKGLSISIK